MSSAGLRGGKDTSAWMSGGDDLFCLCLGVNPFNSDVAASVTVGSSDADVVVHDKIVSVLNKVVISASVRGAYPVPEGCGSVPCP